MALAADEETYVEMEVLNISDFWKQRLQQRQEILLVDIAFDVLAHNVLDIADRHVVIRQL